MNFSLTPSLEDFVRERSKSGDYNNASEVVREALRLLKRTEEHRQLRLASLRESIRVGDDALVQGNFTEIGSDDELDAFFAKL